MRIEFELCFFVKTEFGYIETLPNKDVNICLQEACAVGINNALRPSDAIITSYRAHCWTYLRGESPLSVLAELTGEWLH